MKKPVPILSLIICFTLLVSSCNLPLGGAAPTPQQDTVGTAAAQTVQALSTQIAVTNFPTLRSTNTQAPEIPTDTKEPTNTPEPTETWTPIPPTATIGPLDKLGTVKDVTYPDGTVVNPGTAFTKTWRLTNAGTTTWGPGYSVVFFNGDAMSSPASIPITTSVPPQKTVDVSVTLTAPTTAKAYTGFYKLRNAGGVIFGWGTNADQAFWVKITVGSSSTDNGSGVFAVTSVDMSTDNTTISKICPYDKNITFEATIKVNRSGTITYHWDRFDGTDNSSSSKEKLEFSSAGTKTVDDTMSVSSIADTTKVWERIYIDEPNHQAFSKLTVTLKCK